MRQSIGMRNPQPAVVAGDGKSGAAQAAPMYSLPPQMPAIGGLQSQYANSGLARFGATGGYQPRAYTPRNFEMPGMRANMQSQASQGQPSPAARGGIGGLSNYGDGGMGGGQHGVSNSGMGGISVNGAGMAGRGFGTLGGMALGLGPLSGYLGRAADAAAVSAASSSNGPGDPSATDVSSLGAVNGMDSMSDAYGGSGAGGFGGGSGSGGK
jgi:hypothetical protein